MGRTFDNYDRQVVRMTAVNAIAANDLVLNTEEGFAYKASATQANAILNNQTSPLLNMTIVLLESGAGYGGAVQSAGRTMVELGSGNVAFIYGGDGSDSAKNLNLRIRTISGAEPYGLKTVSSANTITGQRLQKIDANKFVIAWQESTTLKFAIYNNDGTVSVAAATIATVTAGYRYWSMDVLTSGDTVFAYEVSGAAKFKRYNSSGALQGSETTIEAATCTPLYFCVTKLAAGGFVVYYHRSAATAATKFARYDASGVLQGSLTTIVTTSAPTAPTMRTENLATELTGGNLVFLASSGVAAAPDAYIYNSGGSLVTSVDLGSTFATTGHYPSVAVTSTGMDMQWANPSYYPVFISMTASGTLGGLMVVDSVADNGGDPVLMPIIGGGYCGITHVTANGPRLYSHLNGVPFGTPVSLVTGSSTSYFVTSIVHSSNIICIAWQDTTNSLFKYCQYYSGRTAIIGVALNAAAVGETMQVATRGTYTLSTTYMRGNFDARTYAVPGTRGTVSGTTATLFGMSIT